MVDVSILSGGPMGLQVEASANDYLLSGHMKVFTRLRHEHERWVLTKIYVQGVLEEDKRVEPWDDSPAKQEDQEAHSKVLEAGRGAIDVLDFLES